MQQPKTYFKKNSWRDSSLRSCYRVWTIVTTYLPDSQRLHWRHYSGYCTLPLELSWTSDHATMSSALRKLHWLPIKQRIEFKLCLLVHKSLIGHSPAYISDLLTSAAEVPGRPALRTASRGDFIVPRTNRKFGDRAFCVAAPRVWNRLPADLRQLRSTQTFRRHLKTFLFAASYWAPINTHSWTM